MQTFGGKISSFKSWNVFSFRLFCYAKKYLFVYLVDFICYFMYETALIRLCFMFYLFLFGALSA